MGAWYQRFIADKLHLEVDCVHQKSVTKSSSPAMQYLVCPKCGDLAKERLDAVRTGAYAISLYEEVEDHGRSVIYFDALSNSRKEETFRNYTRFEVLTFLYSLSREMLDVSAKAVYSHPFFLSMDANLFWPSIFYFGSIRAALAVAAPDIMWDERLEYAVPRSARMIDNSAEDGFGAYGTKVMKCGHSLCFVLNTGDSEIFMKCGKCKGRYYCKYIINYLLSIRINKITITYISCVMLCNNIQ
jgi:uncharacterized C2H2 Zn-finger protein